MTGLNSQKFQLKIEKEKNLLKGLQRGMQTKYVLFLIRKCLVLACARVPVSSNVDWGSMQ